MVGLSWDFSHPPPESLRTGVCTYVHRLHNQNFSRRYVTKFAFQWCSADTLRTRVFRRTALSMNTYSDFDEPLFCGTLTIEGKSIFWKAWFDKDVHFVQDLLNKNGNFPKLSELNDKYRIKTSASHLRNASVSTQ